VVRSDEMIESLLRDLHAKVEAEPANVDTSRRIAELYEQKGDIENAIAWYQYAADIGHNTDSSLVRKVSDLRVRQYDSAIVAFEEYVAAHHGAPEADAAAAQLADVRRERAQLLLDESRKRVERNPTDLMARFELGEILVSAGNFKEAIQELQKARLNPSIRLRAMNLLGRCYTERGMLDLAADTLSTAASELYQMDEIKKAIVYDLGLVYEKMGQADKSVECMKQIYSVDYGYRDVAERVERSYSTH
jgi:tetratricopeptide (TPR) repeat protein